MATSLSRHRSTISWYVKLAFLNSKHTFHSLRFLSLLCCLPNQRRKDSEQKLRVAQNKKDFVDKMLPIVEMFRSVPRTYPPSTEREVNMHNTYAALLESIVAVIDKYGYAHLLEGKRECIAFPIISLLMLGCLFRMVFVELNKKDRNLAHNVEPMEHELPAPSTSSQHNSSVT